MGQNIKPCKCGSVEFITKPNQYDVYQIIGNKIELIDTLSTEEEIRLFCRECSEEVVYL
jgi:hypothetical protein